MTHTPCKRCSKKEIEMLVGESFGEWINQIMMLIMSGCPYKITHKNYQMENKST
jgi:hypothetical protein